MPSGSRPSRRSALTRRRFLAASSAAALVAGAGTGLSACGGLGGRGGRGRVAIVGAGLAGLVAAYELERDGFEVVLLEARERPGGRVRSLRDPFFADQIAELGAEYIDRSHRVMLFYLRRFDLDLDDLRALGRGLQGAIYVDGQRRPYPEVVTPELQVELDRFDAAVETLARPLDPEDPPARGGAALDERSVGDLLDQLALEPTARQLVERQLRDDYTVEADRLSLLFHAALTKLYAGADDSGNEAFRIDGGNDKLLAALIEEIDAKVDVDAPVTAIERRSDGVLVSVGGAREVEAEFCIVTAPLPLVAEIDFRPALPRTLRTAASELQYGEATKTPLQYSRRFWANEGLDADALTDLSIGTTWEATTAQTGRPGILMSYASGADGRQLARLPDSERIARAAKEIEEVYPEARARIESGATLAWSREQYARGAYAAYAPGQVTRFWRALRRPVGPIYLAGEHVDAYTGFMEGAVRSGRRVSRAIARRAG
ncbi:MAG TPA: FAD-dependent oxidoreductase [Thermoleophilaceae bacterium]|nr:FAD-dependent oxidoreductase [Thermoleophilaceae bacterium]